MRHSLCYTKGNMFFSSSNLLNGAFMSENSIPLYRNVSFDSVRVEVEWRGRPDLDIACFLVSSDKKRRSQFDYIGPTVNDRYGEKIFSRCGSVVYHGDVRDGLGDGSRETITVCLKTLRSDIEKIVFFLFSGEEPFAAATNISLSIYENGGSAPIYHANVPTDLFTAGEYFSRKIGMLEYTKNGWEFNMDGSMSEDSLEDYMKTYGIDPNLCKFHKQTSDQN